MVRETSREAYRAEVLDVPALVDALAVRFMDFVRDWRSHRQGQRGEEQFLAELEATVRTNLAKNIDRIHPTAERKVDIGAAIGVFPKYEEWRSSRSEGVKRADR